MRDYSQPGGDNRFAVERAQQLGPILREIAGFAGLDIVAAGLRVSYSEQVELFQKALADASLRRSSPPVVLRQVQFSMHDLLAVLGTVTARRSQLVAAGALIHLVGVDVPTNRVVVRLGSGLSQCRATLSDLQNELVVIEEPNRLRRRRV